MRVASLPALLWCYRSKFPSIQHAFDESFAGTPAGARVRRATGRSDALLSVHPRGLPHEVSRAALSAPRSQPGGIPCLSPCSWNCRRVACGRVAASSQSLGRTVLPHSFPANLKVDPAGLFTELRPTAIWPEFRHVRQSASLRSENSSPARGRPDWNAASRQCTASKQKSRI